MKKIFIAIILALALWFASPLLRPGFIPTHDGEFSIIRIWQYSKMMGEGYLFSRWAPDLNSGYGVPLFTFYYPFPYFVGSLFHFAGLSLVNSFKLTLGFSYITAITLCFLWLKYWWNRDFFWYFVGLWTLGFGVSYFSYPLLLSHHLRKLLLVQYLHAEFFCFVKL